MKLDGFKPSICISRYQYSSFGEELRRRGACSRSQRAAESQPIKQVDGFKPSTWSLLRVDVLDNRIVRRTLLHGLFPMVRAEILRLLFTNPRQELYVRELARLSYLALHTVQDELAKLRASGIVVSRSNGYHRFYRANSKHPLYMTLRRFVIKGAALPKPSSVRRRKRSSRP
jgi:DNA-binding transcriptional ArsR family regulator